MKRIDETKAALKFMEDLTGGEYPLDRSTNTEVNYPKKKEQRDTEAVKEFIKSRLFESYKDM